MKQHPFEIVYEDERLIAVNKAPGIPTVGERWDRSARSLDRVVSSYLEGKSGGRGRAFLVHRLDKETSGLVLFAKDAASHRDFCMAFEKRRIHKRYIAVVHGRPDWGESEITCDLPLVIDGDKHHRTIVDEYRGKASLTYFKLLASVYGTGGKSYSVLECRPETGRTHQIRVHLARLGFPIVLDPLYGKSAFRSVEPGLYLSDIKSKWRGDAAEERPLVNRLALHAWKLSLEAHNTEPSLDLTAPLPRDMRALVNQLGKIVGKELINRTE
jgi:RluA family pseudouridine synthase